MKLRKIIPLICAAILLSGCENAPVKSEHTSAVTEQTQPTNSAAGDLETDSEESAQADVVFSAKSGVYETSFKLELSSTSGRQIYYTLDGSDPAVSETRALYTEPLTIADRSGEPNVIAAVDPSLISGNFNEYDRKSKEFICSVYPPKDEDVDKCTVVRAVSVGDNGECSAAASGTYFIGTAEEHISGLAESCKAAGNTLAVISLSMNYSDLFDPQSGIYVKGDLFDEALEQLIEEKSWIEDDTARRIAANYNQRGREWERPCHLDFFEFSPESGELTLSQDCGIRIQGNYSRSDWQKGFRLYARKDYGDNRFEYDFFGDKTEVDTYKTFVLRAGGNCAFTAKFNDTYWQTAAKDMNCATKASRPCVVYLNGEYFGLYVLEEDYSEHYFADYYGVDKDEVIVYKGDAETYALGYKLDEGELPEGVTDEGYYFRELMDFFNTHSDIKSDEAYEEFSRLVDIESVRNYFLAEVWINNKWDWPGKNWSMWRTVNNDGSQYGDARWRFMFYDMEFGGVSGEQDINTNTVKEDNYKPLGLLDKDTKNPAVLCFAYLMTNDNFRTDYCDRLMGLSEGAFGKERLNALLDEFIAQYEPLYEQFFRRYPEAGTAEDAIYGGYASAECIRAFIGGREDYIDNMVRWIDKKHQ